MNEAQAGQERLVVLCEVVGGVVAALTDAAAVWWPGLHELPAVELPAPAEQFLCVEAGQVFAERAQW